MKTSALMTAYRRNETRTVPSRKEERLLSTAAETAKPPFHLRAVQGERKWRTQRLLASFKPHGFPPRREVCRKSKSNNLTSSKTHLSVSAKN